MSSNHSEYFRSLRKFDGKSDTGFLVGYSTQSKAFRVYNTRTRHVEENLHVRFLEDKPNVVGVGPEWMFDIDYLTSSMNCPTNPIAGSTKTNDSTGVQDEVETQDSIAEQNTDSDDQFIDMPLVYSTPSPSQNLESRDDQAFLDELARLQQQEKEAYAAADETNELRKTLE